MKLYDQLILLVGLTPPTVTTVGPVTPTTVASNQQQQVQSDEESLIDTYISPFQTTPLYQCFTVRARSKSSLIKRFLFYSLTF